eukprot:2574695-Prymnesium_polylepis.1
MMSSTTLKRYFGLSRSDPLRRVEGSVWFFLGRLGLFSLPNEQSVHSQEPMWLGEADQHFESNCLSGASRGANLPLSLE